MEIPCINKVILSYPSHGGWGGGRGGGGSEEESRNHTNFLEILTCFLTLRHFAQVSIHNYHMKAMIDNTTTMSNINNMAGRSRECNQITRDLWMWCAGHGIWVTVHIRPWKAKCFSR